MKGKIEGRMLGYARVSSANQKTDRQLIALKNFGVDEGDIIVDKVSGRNFDRIGYKKLIKKLRQGDTLVIKSVDRLGRNYEEIIEQWRKITKEIKAFIVVTDLPILNTIPKNELDITGVIITDVVLSLLGYISQMEIEHLRVRQAEGIAIAKAKGIQFGRPPKDKPINLEYFVDEYLQGRISSRKAAEQVGVPRSTFVNWATKPSRLIGDAKPDKNV